MPTKPSKNLETFENPNPQRDYTIEIVIPEFTCLCPKTGQPDFATLFLEYIPDKLCVELKSLKNYIWSFRNEGAFHEAVTNRILGDLVTATLPRYMQLTAEFYVRGGIYTTVSAEYRKSGFSPPRPLPHVPSEMDESHELVGHEPPEPLSPSARPGPGRAETAPTGSRFRMLARARRTDSVEESPAAGRAKPSRPVAPPPPPPPPPPEIFIGIDIGSSSCRALAVDAKGQLLAQAASPIPLPMKNETQITQDPQIWWKAVINSLGMLCKQITPQQVGAIAVDGTSASLLLTDAKGVPVTPALMYNDARATAEAEQILSLAGPRSGAHGATSSLAKLLWLKGKDMDRKATHALHQADWITGMLMGRFGNSDYNNCLKLGYDVEALSWPAWMGGLGLKDKLLPSVHRPGEPIGTVHADIAKKFGFKADCRVLAGTTDGIASFLAAGGSKPGHGVTSLGSTLVIKLLSDTPLFAPEYGVYSHRLGRHWLAGGASNSGGAVLLQYFKLEQIQEMTGQLDPENLTGLAYYPLPGVGERFPVNDPEMLPVLEPLPGDSITFFQGILEGIAGIEAHGYQLLQKLGGPKVSEIRTTGGGAGNAGWTRIRERVIGTPIKPARSDQAAFGTACLAAGLFAKAFSG